MEYNHNTYLFFERYFQFIDIKNIDDMNANSANLVMFKENAQI